MHSKVVLHFASRLNIAFLFPEEVKRIVFRSVLDVVYILQENDSKLEIYRNHQESN